MKGEYIRKQDAVMQLSHNKSRGDDEWELAVASDMEIIRKLPPADVVPVVRCRDCKHCYFADNRVPDEQGWVCEINSSEPVNLNGFCSYGERREESNNG